jgi:hypothetical protein
MDTKSDVLAAIAGFVDWFGLRWLADKAREAESSDANQGTSPPAGSPAAADPATSQCAESCPPSIRGRMYANPGALPVHLEVRHSPRVPRGIDAWCVGIEDVHTHRGGPRRDKHALI